MRFLTKKNNTLAGGRFHAGLRNMYVNANIDL